MKIIMLSGGSGKRLWPLSNNARSKQFLKVLKSRSERNQLLESMAQRVWGQLKELGLDDLAFISTNKAQAEILQNQLGSDTRLIIEPERRDTLPAILLGAAYLHSEQNADPQETVLVLPIDPYVEKDFFMMLHKLDHIIQNTNSQIALIGVKPSSPSSKYGYIVPKTYSSSYLEVSHFVEKPDEVTAMTLLQQHALWNCGIFAFKLDFALSLLKDKNLSVDYEELKENYSLIPKTSFDYAVVENSSNIRALVYEGSWKDLGSWSTLTEEMGTAIIGKGTISEDSVNTHMLNELDIPVTVIGVPNVVVVASPDGILVSDKQESARIKQYTNHYDERPMYVERYWGSYRILDYAKTAENHECITRKLKIDEGKHLSYHYHVHRQEIWTIITGTGILAIDGKLHLVQQGDVLRIRNKTIHAVKALKDLEILEIQTGEEIIEEDVHRIYLTWEEVERYCTFEPSMGNDGFSNMVK